MWTYLREISTAWTNYEKTLDTQIKFLTADPLKEDLDGH